jgi:predicted amidophosphoribosyltransferase
VREVIRGRFFGYAICDYSSDAANLLNEFKDRGQVKVGQLLADQIPKLVSRPEVDLIIYAPSSKQNFTDRGFVPAKIIANRLSKSWSLPLASLELTPAKDQSSLNRATRLQNLVGHMTAVRPLLGERVLLVDDIVTTGATLTEMARAVVEAGGQVSGFITVAETLPKSPRSL